MLLSGIRDEGFLVALKPELCERHNWLLPGALLFLAALHLLNEKRRSPLQVREAEAS